jgi:hypothetical protein
VCKIHSTVHEVSWQPGVICVVASIVSRMLPIVHMKLGVATRGGLVLAAVLLLCALATGEARKTQPSS